MGNIISNHIDISSMSVNKKEKTTISSVHIPPNYILIANGTISINESITGDSNPKYIEGSTGNNAIRQIFTQGVYPKINISYSTIVTPTENPDGFDLKLTIFINSDYKSVYNLGACSLRYVLIPFFGIYK